LQDSTINTFTTTSLAAGNNITVIATNAAGCPGPASPPLIIAVSPVPTATLTCSAAGNQICQGAKVTITASPATNTMYQFFNGTTSLQNTALNTFTTSTLAAGNSITVLPSDLGCIGTTSTPLVITVDSLPQITFNTVNASCNQSSGSATVTVSNGSSPYTYSWNTGASTQTLSAIAAGTYSVSITNSNGCFKDSSIAVVNNSMPTLALSTQTNVTCNGAATGSATVAVTGGSPNYTYSWSNGVTTSTNSPNNQIPNLTAGTWSVTLTDANTCSQTLTVTITQPPKLTAIATSKKACGTDSATAIVNAKGGTGAYTYSWLPSGGSAQTATGLSTGIYTCIVADANGCIRDTTVKVIADSIPKAFAGDSITMGYGSSTTLTGSGGKTYNWTPSIGLSCISCPNPVASPFATTTYILTVTSDSGCVSTAHVTVVITYDCGDVFVPNGFSPNGDGENDVECVYGRCIETMYFAIYDRWGEKVFDTSDPKQCWDGTFRGQVMNTAAFVYYLNAKLVTGETVNKKGNINLVR
jgi:gliding motility-associated-like protein